MNRFRRTIGLLLVALALTSLTPPQAAGAQGLPDDSTETVAAAPDTGAVSEGQAIPAESGIRRGRLVTVGVAMTGVNVGVFLIEKDRWWKNPGRRFHFKSDPGYAHNFDMLGHGFGTELYALLSTRSLQWAGVRHDKAVLWGSIVALAMQTQVEINDGFYVTWGFDVRDQISNTLGVAWFFARERTDWAKTFDTRWSYWPNDIRMPADGLGDEIIGSFSDNYNGHGYWLAARMHRLLPESMKPYWPKPLMLSAGVVLDDWVGRQLAKELLIEKQPGYVSYFISLDLDFKALGLKGIAGDLLNRYHWPAPAIRLYPRPRLFLVFTGP